MRIFDGAAVTSEVDPILSLVEEASMRATGKVAVPLRVAEQKLRNLKRDLEGKKDV